MSLYEDFINDLIVCFPGLLKDEIDVNGAELVEYLSEKVKELVENVD